MNTERETNETYDGEVLHAMTALARLIPPTAGLTIEPGRFGIPRVPLRKLVSLGVALEARRPAVLGEQETRAASGLREALDVGERKVQHDRRVEGVDLRTKRIRVVSLATTITGMLEGMAAVHAPVAEKAAQTRWAMFGSETGIAKMPPLDLWMEIERVRKVVEALPPAATALVPAEMLDALFAAHRELGRALGMYGDAAVIAQVDTNALILFLRRRLVRWVTCVLATAEEESLPSMQRALSALAPIDELRAELARRRARARPAAEDDDADEADEADEADAEPPAPPVTG